MATSQILLYNHITQAQRQKETQSNVIDDILERKICNSEDLDLAGTGDFNATDDQVRDMRLRFTGILTGNRNFNIPARNMLYLIQDDTTGAFAITFQVTGGGGSGITLRRGSQTWIWCDGVNCLDLTREIMDHTTQVSATYQAVEQDRVIDGDTSGGAFTITLPTPAPGKQLLIASTGSTTTLTISPGANTINGSGSNVTITTRWQAIWFIGTSSTNWLGFRQTLA